MWGDVMEMQILEEPQFFQPRSQWREDTFPVSTPSSCLTSRTTQEILRPVNPQHCEKYQHVVVVVVLHH